MDFKSIDFKVERQDLFTKSGIAVDKQAIVRTDLNTVLGVVSPDYFIVTHKEALDKATSVVEQFEDLKLENIATTKGGSRMYAMYQSQKEYIIGNLDTGKPDNIKLRLTLNNSYDGSLKYGFTIGAYRLVCKNGLRTGQDIFAVKQKHTAGLIVDNIMRSAREAVRYFHDKVIPGWKIMNQKEIVVSDVLKQLEESLPDRLFKEVSERVEQKKKSTLWELYNDFTEVVTHEEKYNKSYSRNDKIQRKISLAFSKVLA